jgi:hypothetical protein
MKIVSILIITILAICLPAYAASAQVPGIINYQGRVTVAGTNFDGTGQFKFALVNGGSHVARTATATADLTGQFVTSYTVTDGGSGYVSAPLVSITSGGGSGAAATSSISGGVVINITGIQQSTK